MNLIQDTWCASFKIAALFMRSRCLCLSKYITLGLFSRPALLKLAHHIQFLFLFSLILACTQKIDEKRTKEDGGLENEETSKKTPKKVRLKYPNEAKIMNVEVKLVANGAFSQQRKGFTPEDLTKNMSAAQKDLQAIVKQDQAIAKLFPKVAQIKWEPQIDLSISDPQQNKLADYVKILRCKEGFIPKGPGGIDFDQLPPGKQAEGGRMAWEEARNSPKCKFITGEDTKVDKYYVDFSMPCEPYYYLLNPCFRASHTTAASDSCSHRLKKTHSLPRQNKCFKDEMQKKLNKLSNLKASLDTYLSLAVLTMEKIVIVGEMCEDFMAEEISIMYKREGFVDFAGFMIVGGIALKYGNPNTAVMAAGMIQGLYQGMGPMFGLQQGTSNYTQSECANKEILAMTTESQRKKASQSSLDDKYFLNDWDVIGRYEGLFGIQKEIEKLKTLLGDPDIGDDGLIGEAVTKLKKMQGELFCIDQSLGFIDALSQNSEQKSTIMKHMQEQKQSTKCSQ